MQDTNTYTGEIYIHTCTITGKSYIGQTINGMENRWTGHVRAARRNTDNYKFYNAIRKYGADPWTHESLVQTKSQAESDSEEIRYIDEYDTFHNGYNGTKGGGGTSGVSGKNNHRYDHTVYLIVKPHATGEIFDIFPGTRQEILAAIPELTQSGLSGLLSGDQKIHKGWRLPTESRKKMSASKKGKNNPMYDPTVRTIEKPDATGDTFDLFEGTTQEMLAAIPELTQAGLSLLLRRERKIHKGWKLKYIHLTFRKRRHLLILD
jgi:group I intron endonuclease